MEKLVSAGSVENLRLECLRCGHTWLRRSERLPDICPKCKRRNWQQPIEVGVVAPVLSPDGFFKPPEAKE